MKPLVPALTLLAQLFATTAFAASSDWHRADGADIRLVTNSRAHADGTIRGALQIDLKDGWKTYWRDPGDAGVPPSIDVSTSTNIGEAAIAFPPPHRFDDGYSIWAGYKEPVALPVTFAVPEAGKPARIEADIFLGVCEQICIPVQMHLTVDPSSPGNAGDDELVDGAFAAAPKPVDPEHGLEVAEHTGDSFTVIARLPDGVTVEDLFIAGSESYAVGVPQRDDSDGTVRFQFDISRWTDDDALPPAYFTLVTSDGAYDGFIDIDY